MARVWYTTAVRAPSQPTATPHDAALPRLPRESVGVGLRSSFYEYLLSTWPPIGYFEIISENFMTPGLPQWHKLKLVAARYPIVLHGVGLNLLGSDPLREDYLDQLCALADLVDAPFVSDHLCWTGSDAQSHHDLLPTPYTRDLVEFAVERASYVQKRLGRPFGLENLSSYVSFAESTMTEWDFYSTIVRESNAWFMLDINNIYVSSQNHGFDPHDYLRSIDFSRVLQVHLAGHHHEPNGILVDTHDDHVAPEVWELYKYAWKLGGPFPTLIEWDAKIPPMPVVLDEAHNAVRVRS